MSVSIVDDKWLSGGKLFEVNLSFEMDQLCFEWSSTYISCLFLVYSLNLTFWKQY